MKTYYILVAFCGRTVCGSHLRADFSPAPFGHSRCPCRNDIPEMINRSKNKWIDSGYGLGCKAHDQHVNPTCVNMTPSNDHWCFDSWCYINSTGTCELPVFPSVVLDGSGLLYSYETCGAMAKYTSWDLAERWAKEAHLNVIYMTNSGGWKGSYCTGKKEHDCYGAFFDIGRLMLTTAASVEVVERFTFEDKHDWTSTVAFDPMVIRQVLRDKPNMAHDHSIFDLCVYATGMGYIDMCIGAFTMTRSRSRLTHFIKVAPEPVYLIAKATEATTPSFWDLFVKVGDPFTGNAWAAIFVTLLLIALAMMYSEWRRGGSLEYAQSLTHATIAATHQTLGTVLGVSLTEPTRWTSKLLQLAVGFIVLYSVACYTANLASILVVRNIDTSRITSFDDVLAQKIHVCVAEIFAEIMVEQYNLPEGQMHRVSASGEILSAFSENKCEAALIPLEDLDEQRYQTNIFACNAVRIGDPLIYIDQGFPVSARVHRMASLTFSSLRDRGFVQRLMTANQLKDRCFNSMLVKPTAVDIQGFMFPLILCGCLIAVATISNLSWDIFERRFSGSAPLPPSHEDDDRHKEANLNQIRRDIRQLMRSVKELRNASGFSSHAI